MTPFFHNPHTTDDPADVDPPPGSAFGGGTLVCPQGHLYVPENVYVKRRPNGRPPTRECRTCRRERKQRRREAGIDHDSA